MSRRAATILAVSLLVTGLRADQGLRSSQPAASTSLVMQVRTALGHGSAAQASRLVAASNAPANDKELATALIEIYQGQDEQARPRLEKLAQPNPLGDASLELGLLDLRHGRRDQARVRLTPLTNVRTFHGVDDYFRLARAATATHDLQLANDAYQQIGNAPGADIQSTRGDLFLYVHQRADAVTNFKLALSLDPAWIPAQIGLARAFDDDDPPVARAAFEGAKKSAPDDPDVWELGAEQALLDEDWDAAGQALDKLAALKPGTVDEMAMRAALAFAQGRPADIEPAVARAAAIDSTSALAYDWTAEQAARLYHFDDAIAFERKAIAIDPQDRDSQTDLGLDLMRIGDEKAARVALEASWKLDDFNQLTKNLLDLLDKLDKFEVVPDGDLIFKFSKDEAPVMKLYAIPLGEEAMRTFEAHYQFKPKGPILVEVFPDHDSFAVRAAGLPGLDPVLGACFGRVVAFDSPHARKDPDEFSWQATEWHELAHVFTLQLSKYRVPRWLTEGMSVFEEHRRNPPWGREEALQYAQLWSQNKTFGVKGLPTAFKDPENFGIGYFEASLVVEHLVALKGDAGLRDLLLAYADGATDEQAFERAFGESIDAVDASFRQFVNTQYGALAAALKPLAGPPIAPTDVGALRQRAAAAPGSFLAQVTLGQALVADKDDKDAVAPLERAAQLAPQAQGPESPHALLAGIDERAGDNAGARRELRALLTYDHDALTAARELTKLATAAHADTDLDYALKVTTDLDPFDADAHAAQGRRELAAKQFEPALKDFRAVLALGPTNPADAHTNASEALFDLNRSDEARHEVLAALEEAPTYAPAQDLLLKIEPPMGGSADAPGSSGAPAGSATPATTAPSTATPAAPADRYAVVIEGVSGGEPYDKLFRQWLDGMVGVLKNKLAFDASHISVLAETPGTGEEKSTADGVKLVFGKLAKAVKPNDLLFVMLIGHGTGEGSDIKFNLVGPDLTVEEWNALLKPVPGRLVFVDASSSSYPFLKGLAAPGRVIVTATRSTAERFAPVFADGFIQAFSTSAADLDKNGRISMWEAFEYASHQAADHYQQTGHLATEHAMLDDSGTGAGRDASAQNQNDSLAALTYLDAVATPTSSNPDTQRLYDRQRALGDQIDALRRRRSAMTPADYDQAFEPLELELAAISHGLRQRGAR